MKSRQKPVCRLSDIPESGHLVSGDGKWIIIDRPGERVCVARNACPHQSLSLEGGDTFDGQYRCPHHGIAFSLTDGSITDDRGFWDLEPLQIVENRIDGENVIISEAWEGAGSRSGPERGSGSDPHQNKE